jgi:hypothetical protein
MMNNAGMKDEAAKHEHTEQNKNTEELKSHCCK